MKKTLLFLLVCLTCNIMTGQGSLVMSPLDGTDNIVRFESTSGFHISCSQQGGDVHFALTNMNMFKDVFVATDLIVRDFEIIDRLVFFCGERFGGGSGFLGWFDIDSLFYYGGNAHVDLTLSTLGLVSLENIELFKDQGGSIHVAGYGKMNCPYPPPPPNGCVPPYLYLAFEAVGSLATGMQYRVLELQDHACYSEVVDMAVTDNYVVYLERNRSQECHYHYGFGIMLQPFPKFYMFPSPPYPYFYFETTTCTTLYVPGTIHAYVVPFNDDPYLVAPRITYTTEDEVAVCSYRRDFDYNTWGGDSTRPCGGGMDYTSTPTSLAIRTYDFSPLLSNNPVPMTNAAIAPMTPGEVKSIDGFRYDSQKKHFVVLHRQKNLSSVDEHAVTTIDYSTGVLPSVVFSYYQTAYNTINQWLPCSLCLTTPNEYTVGGYNSVLGNKNYMYWHDNIVNPVTGACDALIRYSMKPIPTMVAKNENNPNNPTSWSPLVFLNVIPVNRVASSCTTICE